MFRRLLTLAAVVTMLASAYSSVMAQGMGGYGNSGGFGSGGMGSSGFGSSGFGSSGFGSSGFGSSGFGSSGFGGMGSGGFGSGGFGSGGMGGSGFGNSGFGNSGFGGNYGNSGFGGNGGGQNFVGRDAGDMQAVWGQMGRASTQFFNSMNRNNNRGNSGRRQSSKNVVSQPQPMRVDVKVAFDAPRVAPAQVASGIQTRLARIAEQKQWARPNLRMEGDVAVLTGQAANESERAVMAQLLAIEPGVREVRNEMTVAPSATAAPAVLPPSN